MIKEHEVDEKIKISTFIKKIKAYGYNNIETTAHTFFRLSEKQRKIYTEKELKTILFYETPLQVGIQQNGNYAVIYLYEKYKKLIKILLDLSIKKLYIVTFYFLDKRQTQEFKYGKNIK